jgi:hypothetical protein
VAELALATGLPDKAPDAMRGLLDRFLVSNLWLALVGVDLELAHQAVDDDFQVQLAHAGDDGLPCLLIGMDLERRVLLG